MLNNRHKPQPGHDLEMLGRLKTTDFMLRGEPNIILNRTTDFCGDQNKKEFRIDHTFDAFGPFARHLRQGEITFPIFKNHATIQYRV